MTPICIGSLERTVKNIRRKLILEKRAKILNLCSLEESFTIRHQGINKNISQFLYFLIRFLVKNTIKLSLRLSKVELDWWIVCLFATFPVQIFVVICSKETAIWIHETLYSLMMIGWVGRPIEIHNRFNCKGVLVPLKDIKQTTIRLSQIYYNIFIWLFIHWPVLVVFLIIVYADLNFVTFESVTIYTM